MNCENNEIINLNRRGIAPFLHLGLIIDYDKYNYINTLNIAELPSINAFSISEWVNDMWKYKPLVFNFTGWENTGDNMTQTPVWIRPRSLMKASKELKDAGIIQVVGHTHQNQIDANVFLGKPEQSSSITQCCKGITKTALGFIWKYNEEIT